MRRGCLAVLTALFLVSTANADYLFMQYMMGVRRSQPGQPAPGAPPAPPQTPSPGGPGGQPPGENNDVVILTVNAVVELTKKTSSTTTVVGRVKHTVFHKWGSTNIYGDDQLITKLISNVKSVKTRFVAKKDDLAKAKNNDRIYDLAEWALNHGLVDEFATLMDEQAKAGQKSGLEKLDKAVECYSQVKEAMKARVDREDNSEVWHRKLGFRISQSEHYSLLYNATLSDPDEVKERLEMLEKNFKAVYFWFALKGQVLKMPNQKLVTVLLDQPEQFKVQRAKIEDEPLVSDGFFSARDNVVVFSTQRLDSPSVLFNSQMKSRYQEGWDRKALLSGKGISKAAGKSLDDQYKMQTLALLDKSLEEEGARAAVTHEATRQIFVGAGLQRPMVVMPDWVQFGMASVFETAKGPFPLAPVEVRVPYWGGYGAPSWLYTRIFKSFEQDGAQTEGIQIVGTNRDFTRAGKLLESTVRDVQFNQARDLIARAGDEAGARKLIEARTNAWALCYYLTRQRTTGVMKLFAELEAMPRDLELEPDQVLGCFCRAFDVADITGTKMDAGKFEALAKDWIGFMATTSPPGFDVRLGVEAPPPGPGGTGGPTGPGGGPTGPGGGGRP